MKMLLQIQLLGLCLLVATAPGAWSETNEVPKESMPIGPPVPEGVTATNANEVSQELLRAFLHLQEKVHATQLAIERARSEADVAATRNETALVARLESIESSMVESRERDLELLQSSHRHMLALASLFAVAGFVALGLTSWQQWRTASRLSEIASSMPSALALPAPRFLDSPGPGMAHSDPSRLGEALARLEERIADFEQDPGGNLVLSSTSANTDEDAGQPTGFPPTNGEAHEPTQESARIVELLREGQRLLARDEAEEAVTRFDALLELQPQHAEALLRKGTALERLQRNQEAIECYDKAIAADERLTMAYLYKGGLFNRMERFGEAMDCYERALRVQGERRAG